MRTYLKKVSIFLCAFFLLCGVSHADFISEITEIAFPSAVLKSSEPVLVVFYSGSFVGKFAKSVDEYARKNSAVKILKMEIGLNTVTVSKYKIKRNHTFVFFADGEEIERTTSINTCDDLTEFIGYCLEKHREKLKEEKKNEWVPERNREDS